MKLLKRRMTAFLTLVFLLTAMCLSGCNVDPDDKSVLVLKADPNNQTRNTAEATTGKQSETENGTGKAEAETTLTASAATATNGTNTTGAAKKDNVTVGKATEGTAQATKATRKPTTATTTKPSGTLTAAQAKSIAEDRIERYNQCYYEGFCCDIEEVNYEDVEKYLTSYHKEYFFAAHRITCCHSLDEVKQHIARCLDASMIPAKLNERSFFFDDKKNLYYVEGACGKETYGDITLVKYTADTIVAKAKSNRYDSAYDEFTIKKKNGNWIIIGVEKLHYRTPRYGTYSAAIDEYWGERYYANLTLRSDGTFTLDANYNFSTWKGCSPFTADGTYFLEDESISCEEDSIYYGDFTYINFYFDSKCYMSLIVGTDALMSQGVVFDYRG